MSASEASSRETAATSAESANQPPHRRLWLVPVLLVVCTILVMAYIAKRPRPQPKKPQPVLANVEARRLVAEEYRETLVLPAVLEADRQAAASFEVPGILAVWQVAEGAAVTAGMPLAMLNTDVLAATARENEARLAAAVEAGKQAEIAVRQATISESQAASSLALAMSEVERVRLLARDQAVSQAAVDVAENAAAQAKLAVEGAKAGAEQAKAGQTLAAARVAELEAALAAAKLQLDKAVLRAPFAGFLDKHLLKQGEVVAPGQAAAMVYDLAHLRAAVDVPDRFVPFLDATNPALQVYLNKAAPGAKPEVRVRVELPGLPKLAGGRQLGLELDAELVRVAQAADPLSNTFRVELRLPNPGMALKQGIVARAHIQYLTYPAAVVLPVGAIQVSDVGPRVLALNEKDGRHFASVRDIEPVSIRGNSVLVISGVQAGELLIVAGGRGVVDGEEVNVVAGDISKK